MVAFTLPVLYEKYETEVDRFGQRANVEMKKHYMQITQKAKADMKKQSRRLVDKVRVGMDKATVEMQRVYRLLENRV